MLDPLFLAVGGAVSTYKLARAWLQRVDEPPPRRAKKRSPAPMRPEDAPQYWFDPIRGAHLTTPDRVQRYLNTRLFTPEGHPRLAHWLAGLWFPTNEYLNRLTFVTGLPGAGKTVHQQLAMMSLAQGGFGPIPPTCRLLTSASEAYRPLRWVVIDPAGTYLPFLYQVLPEDVEVIRISPQDPHGWYWEVAEDVPDGIHADLFVDAFYPEELFKESGDGRFWYGMAKEATLGLLQLFHDRGSDWKLHDLLIPFIHAPLMRAAFLQSERTRSLATHDLVGRLGRSVIVTGRSVIGRMATAVAMASHARKGISMRGFRKRKRVVLYLGYTPETIPALASFANALVFMLVKWCLKHKDPTDHTYFWLDELKYMSGLAAIDEIAAFGRGSGLGMYSTCQGIPGLIVKFGEKRVKELIDIISTWVCFTCGADTAEEFCRRVGQIEGIQKSISVTNSYTFSMNESTTSSPNGNSYTWGTSKSWSHSTTESWALNIKAAILASELTNLRDADVLNDRLSGYCFHPNVGAFQFQTPFLRFLNELPPRPFDVSPERPAWQQRLAPWTAEDVACRLKLDLSNKEMKKALRKVWGDQGGVQ